MCPTQRCRCQHLYPCCVKYSCNENHFQMSVLNKSFLNITYIFSVHQSHKRNNNTTKEIYLLVADFHKCSKWKTFMNIFYLENYMHIVMQFMVTDRLNHGTRMWLWSVWQMKMFQPSIFPFYIILCLWLLRMFVVLNNDLKPSFHENPENDLVRNN